MSIDTGDAHLFVLHIGRQKTGTTSIQRTFTDNTNLLAAAGIIYPFTGRARYDSSAHHDLAVALNPAESDGSALPALRDKLRAELTGRPSSTVVFSSEAFQRITDFSRLEAFFPGTRPIVVCYLRDCLAAKQSSWAQAVHASRMSRDFVDYAARVRLNYKSFIHGWSDFAQRIELGLFDRQRLQGGDVVVDFLMRIGHADVARTTTSLTRNDGLPSLGGNLLHIKRMINLARTSLAPMPGEFDVISRLLEGEPRWQGRWFVSPADLRAIAATDRKDREFLQLHFGEVHTNDPASAPPSPDLATLKDDLYRVLSEPELANAFAPLQLPAAADHATRDSADSIDD